MASLALGLYVAEACCPHHSGVCFVAEVMTGSFWASVSPYVKRDGANKPQGCWEASKRLEFGNYGARARARLATATPGEECWRHSPQGAMTARAAQGKLAGRPHEPAVQNEASGEESKCT